jgi:hypothetical protein
MVGSRSRCSSLTVVHQHALHTPTAHTAARLRLPNPAPPRHYLFILWYVRQFLRAALFGAVLSTRCYTLFDVDRYPINFDAVDGDLVILLMVAISEVFQAELLLPPPAPTTTLPVEIRVRW